MREEIALFGGIPSVREKFEVFNSYGIEELEAASKVIRSGILSKYIGAPGPDFMGGPKVREMEQVYSEYFDVKHAIAVNSWTSGLIAAVGAIGIEPGDEVILCQLVRCLFCIGMQFLYLRIYMSQIFVSIH
jgi:hypothetical protein